MSQQMPIGSVSPTEAAQWIADATGLERTENGRVDTRQAAQVLGVTQRTIQRALKGGYASTRGKLAQRLSTHTPRPTDATPSSSRTALAGATPRYPPEQVRDYFQGGFGVAPDNSGLPDLERISAATGVSVERLRQMVHRGARSDRSLALRGIGTPWTAAQLRSARERDLAERQAFFQGISNRPNARIDRADLSTPQGAQEKLSAVYTTAKNKDIDVKAAAKDLGVSTTTVRRWMTRGLNDPKRSKAFQRLQDHSAKIDATPAKRTKLVDGITAGRGANVFTVAITAMQGPEEPYARERTCAFNYTELDQADAFKNAYINGGHAGAKAWLTNNSDVYLDQWHIGDVQQIEIGWI